jgi:glycosyltransferase involved in cell wall biosynthesis
VEQPDISFIVSCYDRPDMLRCCLASLAVQTHKNFEVIVTDNAPKASENQLSHEGLCNAVGAKYINTEATGCYHSAEMGALLASGTFVNFPSDDSYYMPTFAEEMLKAAWEQSLEMVFCEMVYNGRWPSESYHLMGTAPCLNHIDKTGFLIRRDKFYGFPDKGEGGYCAADGLLIDRLVREGIKHNKVHGILAVHN